MTDFNYFIEVEFMSILLFIWAATLEYLFYLNFLKLKALYFQFSLLTTKNYYFNLGNLIGINFFKNFLLINSHLAEFHDFIIKNYH